MLQISIQKSNVNIYHFPLYIFNYHSCHHNSECDIIHHWGIVVCEINTWNLAETFATSLAQYTPFLFTLNTHLHPTNLRSFGRSFLFHMSPHTHVQHLLELQANSLSPFLSGYQIRIPQSLLEAFWFIRI